MSLLVTKNLFAMSVDRQTLKPQNYSPTAKYRIDKISDHFRWRK